MPRGRPVPVDAADVPRERLDLHLDGDGGRRRPTSACARSSRPRCSRLIRERARRAAVRRADRADLAGQRARRGARRAYCPACVVITAGAPPAAATIERLEGEFGWDVTQVYGLTETAPFITVCDPAARARALSAADRAGVKARQGVELLTSGELLVRGRGRRGSARGRRDARRDRRPRQRRHDGLLQRSGGDRAGAWATAGSTPATPPWCTRTATSRSATGSRT